MLAYEGTLSTGPGSKCGAGSTNCYAFQTPPSYAKWLPRAGFNVVNLANNHAYDYGQSGFDQTRRALRKAGLTITGPRGVIAVMRAGGVRVALIGFASYAWANDLTDIPAALKEAHRVLKRGGRFYCMEFSSSEWPGFSRLYEAWASEAIPRIGKAVARDEDSYRYLVESIRRFPRPQAFRRLVSEAGFVRAAAEPMLGGLVSIHSGWKI